MATNTEIAERLGLAHSTVSRMRSGERIGSTPTLSRISSEFDVPLETVVAAATKAHAGDKSDWIALMEGLAAAKADA